MKSFIEKMDMDEGILFMSDGTEKKIPDLCLVIKWISPTKPAGTYRVRTPPSVDFGSCSCYFWPGQWDDKVDRNISNLRTHLFEQGLLEE